MNAQPGLKHWHKGYHTRTDRTSIVLRGTEITVDYKLDGSYIAATDTDAAETPVVTVKGAQIGGVDVWRLVSVFEDEITEMVERQVVT